MTSLAPVRTPEHIGARLGICLVAVAWLTGAGISGRQRQECRSFLQHALTSGNICASHFRCALGKAFAMPKSDPACAGALPAGGGLRQHALTSGMSACFISPAPWEGPLLSQKPDPACAGTLPAVGGLRGDLKRRSCNVAHAVGSPGIRAVRRWHAPGVCYNWVYGGRRAPAGIPIGF